MLKFKEKIRIFVEILTLLFERLSNSSLSLNVLLNHRVHNLLIN